MRDYLIALFIFVTLAVLAQHQPHLVKTIDSLYDKDQAAQLKLKSISQRQASKDSLRMQDSLKKQPITAVRRQLKRSISNLVTRPVDHSNVYHK